MECFYNGTDRICCLFNSTAPNVSNGTNITLCPEMVFEYPVMGPPIYIYVYVTLINAVVFLVGVLGNIFVIQVVARIRSMRRRMNYFLVSLSIADLQLLIIGMPSALMEFYSKKRWYLGDFMCRAVPFLENTSHHCSVLTLLGIGFERYYAICHPLRETAATRFTSPHILIPAVWIVSCIVSLPFAIISSTREEQFYDDSIGDVCFTDMNSLMASVYIVVLFALFLALPLLLLTIMYTAIIMTLAATTMTSSGSSIVRDSGAIGSAGNSNSGSMSSLHRPTRQIYRMDSEQINSSRAVSSRRQVVRMMITVMALYFLCLLPLRCFQLWVQFCPPEQLENLGFEGYLNLVNSVRILMYINSAGNPIIYGLLSTNFRVAFRKSFNCYSNRLDGYRYNTTYYSNNLHRQSSHATGQHLEGTPSRNAHVTFAQSGNRIDSQENITSVLGTEQLLPLTEFVHDSETGHARTGSGQLKDSYTPGEVVVNPNYQSLKTEVCLRNHKQNGNVYV